MKLRIPLSAIIGASVGAILTVVIQVLTLSVGRGDSAWAIALPWFVIIWPGFSVARLIGWEWSIQSGFVVTFPMFAFMVLINSLIIALVVGVPCSALYRFARR